MKLKPSNGIKVYCKSMGKVFRVRYIATSMDEANEYMRRNSDCGLIASEPNDRLLYIAELYGMTVKSDILPD